MTLSLFCISNSLALELKILHVKLVEIITCLTSVNLEQERLVGLNLTHPQLEGWLVTSISFVKDVNNCITNTIGSFVNSIAELSYRNWEWECHSLPCLSAELTILELNSNTIYTVVSNNHILTCSIGTTKNHDITGNNSKRTIYIRRCKVGVSDMRNQSICMRCSTNCCNRIPFQGQTETVTVNKTLITKHDR